MIIFVIEIQTIIIILKSIKMEINITTEHPQLFVDAIFEAMTIGSINGWKKGNDNSITPTEKYSLTNAYIEYEILNKELIVKFKLYHQSINLTPTLNDNENILKSFYKMLTENFYDKIINSSIK
jgi:hypothetical protein